MHTFRQQFHRSPGIFSECGYFFSINPISHRGGGWISPHRFYGLIPQNFTKLTPPEIFLLLIFMYYLTFTKRFGSKSLKTKILWPFSHRYPRFCFLQLRDFFKILVKNEEIWKFSNAHNFFFNRSWAFKLSSIS